MNQNKSFKSLLFCDRRSHIPIIKPGLPGKQDYSSIAKHTVKEELEGTNNCS